jgi:hypothetical protein
VNKKFKYHQIEEKKCCPAQELMQYLIDHHLPETRKLLKFLPKYQDEANKTLLSIANKLGRPIDEVTFVGIHHRRTVSETFGVNFTNILCTAFTYTDPKSAKKYSQAVSLFCVLGIFVRKSFTSNVDEIDP